MIGGLHDALERVLRGDVLQLDGQTVAVLDGHVEEDVDAERVAERLVDLLDRCLVRKAQRDRLVGGGVELRRLGLGDVLLGRFFLDVVDGTAGGGELRVVDDRHRLGQLHRGELVGGVEPDGDLQLRRGHLG